MAKRPAVTEGALRALSIVGVVVVLLFVAWGIIYIAFSLSTFFEKLSSSSTIKEQALPSSTIETPKAPQSPAKTSSSPAKPASSSTFVAASRTRTLAGLPDLAVSILSAQPQGGDKYAVQFAVENIGTNIALAGWSFTASIPAATSYTYSSGPQQALYPGDKVMYTLGFDLPAQQYQPAFQYYSPYQYYAYPQNPVTLSSNCGYVNDYIYNGVYNYQLPTYRCTPSSPNTPTYVYGYGYLSAPIVASSKNIFSVTVTSTSGDMISANNTASFNIEQGY